jgi:hypothetical protein
MFAEQVAQRRVADMLAEQVVQRRVADMFAEQAELELGLIDVRTPLVMRPRHFLAYA